MRTVKTEPDKYKSPSLNKKEKDSRKFKKEKKAKKPMKVHINTREGLLAKLKKESNLK